MPQRRGLALLQVELNTTRPAPRKFRRAGGSERKDVTMNRNLNVSLLGLLVAALSLGGCASQSELPPQVTQDLVTLRDQIVQGKAQVQTTSNAARDLTQRPQAQLEPQINRLTDAINKLESLATNARTQFASTQERTEAYFVHWHQQMQGMSKSLAQQGEARRAQSQASLEELKKRVEALREEFRLSEVSRYLNTDTTSAGVKAVTQQVNAAAAREKDIMSKADAVIAQIDAMRGGR
jgi:hypothetical protein